MPTTEQNITQVLDTIQETFGLSEDAAIDGWCSSMSVFNLKIITSTQESLVPVQRIGPEVTN